MKTDPEPTEFRTRKKTRVYKRCRVVNGAVVVPDNWTFRAKQDGKTTYFNLGKFKREAGAKADEIAAFLAVDGNTVSEALVKYSDSHRNRDLRQVKAPAPAPKTITVGGMVELYAAVSSHLSAVTVRNNIAALRHIAGGILGLEKLGVNQTKVQRETWRLKVDAFPISGFAAHQVELFRQKELRACGTDHAKRGAVSTTLNSYMRSCRSIFAEKLMPMYHGLELPNPLPFRGIKPLPEPAHRYHSKINVETLISAAKEELYPTDKAAWIVVLLSIGAGLRRGELDKLTVAQINFEERRIWIGTTEHFRPKARNSEDFVDLTQTVAKFLEEYCESEDCANRDFLLPGRAPDGIKLRCGTTFRKAYAWLRKNGVTAQKPLHTLRKEAGSMIYQKSGSTDRAANFLRNDPRVAREHYIGRKERLELEIPGL